MFGLSFRVSVCLLLTPLAAGNDDILVCKQAGIVFPGLDASSAKGFQLPQARTGKKGPKGDPGLPGRRGEMGPAGVVDYEHVQNMIDQLNVAGAFQSCAAIKRTNSKASNGLYNIKDNKGSIYRTYCDMETGGGGWTLVASVHENYLGGKCTTGDRWSSEHGNNPNHPHGDGAWENTRMFGAPESAASDDYKNQGYFNMEARDVMIWHVPNNTPLQEYKDRAFMMYHTTSGFLAKYGSNLFNLFKKYPLRNRLYNKQTGNGPSSLVVWDRGDNSIMVQNTPPNNRRETEPGYVQFRVINHEGGAFAVCPGYRMKPGFGNSEHVCIGGTSNHGESSKHCGDFSSKDWSGYASGTGWSANKVMTESVVMIFYR